MKPSPEGTGSIPSPLRPFAMLGQLLAWGISVLLLTGALNSFQDRSFPDVQTAVIVAALAVSAVAVIALCPLVFFRLGRALRLTSYVGLIAAIVLVPMAAAEVRAGYDKTPEGKRMAAKRAESDAYWSKVQADRAAMDAQDASDEAEADRIALRSGELAHCATEPNGGIPALQRAVSTSMHNPASFSHDKTEAIAADEVDAGTYNVRMRFRAENGFGAIRPASVRAKIGPLTCSVEGVSNITPL